MPNGEDEAQHERRNTGPENQGFLRHLGMKPEELENLRKALDSGADIRKFAPPRRTAPYRRPPNLRFRNPDVWPEPVTAGALLPSLMAVIRNHVAIPEPSALAVALWAMHTHVLDIFAITPRLAIRSAQSASGKTTLLSLLGHLVPRPLDLCAAAPRAMLDSLGYRPTLLIDDATGFVDGGKDLRVILRNGRQRAGAHLLRVAESCLQNVDIFTALAIAIEGRLPPILAGRSIEIRLERLKPGETVTRLRPETAPPLTRLHRMMARWAEARSAELQAAEAQTKTGENENWIPLLLIAADAGPDWELRARTAMQAFAADSPRSLLELLLADIRPLLDQRVLGQPPLPGPHGKHVVERDRIRSCDLARLLAELEGRPWCEWGKSARPVTPHALAKLLAGAGIGPTAMRFRTGDQNGPGPEITERGYLHSQFADAFERYLPPSAAKEVG